MHTCAGRPRCRRAVIGFLLGAVIPALAMPIAAEAHTIKVVLESIQIKGANESGNGEYQVSVLVDYGGFSATFTCDSGSRKASVFLPAKGFIYKKRTGKINLRQQVGECTKSLPRFAPWDEIVVVAIVAELDDPRVDTDAGARDPADTVLADQSLYSPGDDEGGWLGDFACPVSGKKQKYTRSYGLRVDGDITRPLVGNVTVVFSITCRDAD